MMKATYDAKVQCLNCGNGGPTMFNQRSRDVKIPRGKKIEDMACPDCGCKELVRRDR
jgi:hypothetical protein